MSTWTTYSHSRFCGLMGRPRSAPCTAARSTRRPLQALRELLIEIVRVAEGDDLPRACCGLDRHGDAFEEGFGQTGRLKLAVQQNPCVQSDVIRWSVSKVSAYSLLKLPHLVRVGFGSVCAYYVAKGLVLLQVLFLLLRGASCFAYFNAPRGGAVMEPDQE